MFCCLKTCLNGFSFAPSVTHISKENPIRLDTSFMGYEVVIVKEGQRVCGAGAALGNAPLVQSKAYFEVKIQQGGSWSIGLATRHTNLNLTQGGMDEHSWTLCSDGNVYHNKQKLFRITGQSNGAVSISATQPAAPAAVIPQEGDIIGISFDHIHLKYYLNGKELEGTVTNCKGTLYPALYVGDGAILDVILDNFTYPVPSGFERVMLEQSLL